MMSPRLTNNYTLHKTTHVWKKLQCQYGCRDLRRKINAKGAIGVMAMVRVERSARRHEILDYWVRADSVIIEFRPAGRYCSVFAAILILA